MHILIIHINVPGRHPLLGNLLRVVLAAVGTERLTATVVLRIRSRA